MVNKHCSILTIQDGYTNLNIIPPLLDQLKSMSKIFMIQFDPRGAFIDAIDVKTFDYDESPMLLPTPPIEFLKDVSLPLVSFGPRDTTAKK